jgi:2-keto-4-pentenoate hydratase
MPFDDLPAIMERNVFHRAAVFGPPVQGVAELAGLTARMTRNGRAEPEIDVAGAALPPAETIELVGSCLAEVGDELRPGDVIIAGSLVTAVPLEAADERVELEIDGLGAVALEIRSA